MSGYRVDFTARVDGLEYSGQQWCADQAEVDDFLRHLAELGAWDIQVHEPEEN